MEHDCRNNTIEEHAVHHFGARDMIADKLEAVSHNVRRRRVRRKIAHGQNIVEYALLITFGIGVLAAATPGLTTAVGDLFGNITSGLQVQLPDNPTPPSTGGGDSYLPPTAENLQGVINALQAEISTNANAIAALQNSVSQWSSGNWQIYKNGSFCIAHIPKLWVNCSGGNSYVDLGKVNFPVTFKSTPTAQITENSNENSATEISLNYGLNYVSNTGCEIKVFRSSGGLENTTGISFSITVIGQV